jgi:CRISPR/Cas system endoribonuclease Cas6 (RAMP superfamily)
MDRPSYKEINRKIKQAKEAVSENHFSILNPVIIAADALELGRSSQYFLYPDRFIRRNHPQPLCGAISTATIL